MAVPIIWFALSFAGMVFLSDETSGGLLVLRILCSLMATASGIHIVQLIRARM